MTALALFRPVLLAALLAGLGAGAVTWAVRQVTVVPLILEAEVQEQATHAGQQHDAEEAWHPGEGTQRILFTLITDLLAAFAFALLLGAIIQVTGAPMDWRRGVAWGLAGFITFSLGPALSLPPELPGTESAALHARQIWWAATVLLTGIGLLLARFAPHPAWYAAAALAVLLPHVIGAPHPVSHGHTPPGSAVITSSRQMP